MLILRKLSGYICPTCTRYAGSHCLHTLLTKNPSSPCLLSTSRLLFRLLPVQPVTVRLQRSGTSVCRAVVDPVCNQIALWQPAGHPRADAALRSQSSYLFRLTIACCTFSGHRLTNHGYVPTRSGLFGRLPALLYPRQFPVPLHEPVLRHGRRTCLLSVA